MRVAIVGTRPKRNPDGTWVDPEWVAQVEAMVKDYVRGLPACTVVVSGGALGPDRWAVGTAQQQGRPFRVFKADWNGPSGLRAGFDRNTLIVGYVDKVVAWWDGISHGTADTIEKAKAAKVEVEIHELQPQRT